MALVSVTIRTVDDQVAPAPISGVLVQVFDGLNAFVTEGVTDIAGELIVSLLGDVSPVLYTARLFKLGVSFPGASIELSVTDPPSPPNEFTAVGHVGMTGSLVRLRTVTDDPTPAPVPSCLIRLYDSLDNFMTESLTDADGYVELSLSGSPSGTTYIARFLKTGWTFLNGPTQQFLVLDPLPVGATNDFDFQAHTAVIPESLVPDYCLISGYLCLPSGAAIAKARVRFTPRPQIASVILSGGTGQSTPAIVQRQILMGEVTVLTDQSGYLEVMLPHGGVFDVDVLGWSDSMWPSSAAVVVPLTAGAKLEDVLYPYSESVVLGSTDPITLSVGGFIERSIKIIGSNDQETFGKPWIEKFISWTVASPSLVDVSITQEGLFRVDGRAPGTTTIAFSRVPDTYIPRVPDVPALIAPVLSVEVTA